LADFVAKSLFALAIKNFPGFRRDFCQRCGNDKLADELGSAIEGTRISSRRSDVFTEGKLAPGNWDICNNMSTRRR
jgi:hypothetical protein